MPTPMRVGTGSAQVGAGEAGACCGSMSSPEKAWKDRGRSRDAPPRKLDREEACDERSAPQDVTSSWYNAEGSNCSKRALVTEARTTCRVRTGGRRSGSRTASHRTARNALRKIGETWMRPLWI